MSYLEGPYLLAALICERVLEEKDGTKSAIRILDRITRGVGGPNPPATMQPFPARLTLFIRLKSGNVRGVRSLKIVLVAPSGENSQSIPVSVNFEGEEDKGTDIVAQMQTLFTVTGIHWIEVYFEDECMTRIPLRIVYIPQVTRMPGPHGPSGNPGPGIQQ